MLLKTVPDPYAATGNARPPNIQFVRRSGTQTPSNFETPTLLVDDEARQRGTYDGVRTASL